MLLLPLLIISILFYFTGKRVTSSLIFFFFLTDGFQLIPEALFETHLGFYKSIDFAFIYIFFIFIIGYFKYKDFIPNDKLSKGIGLFCLFIVLNILMNRYIYHIPWSEIIRTSRHFFFVLGYFVFRRLGYAEIKRIMLLLFYITLFLCIVYIIQCFIGIPLLTGDDRKGTMGQLNRYYNIPTLYYYYLFYTLFINPYSGKAKYISMVVFMLVAILSLHRGLIFAVFILFIWGIYVSQGGIKGVFKYLLFGSILMLPFLNIIIERVDKKTSKDIDSVMMGAFVDYGDELSVDGTFLFRVALFYERFDYIIKDAKYILCGVGYMTEDSSITDRQFDFKIGLKDKDDDSRIVQLDTSDIALVNFLLRLGMLGTFLFLGLYFFLGKYFYQRRKNNEMLVPLLYIMLLLLNALTSSLLFYTYLIILPMIDYTRNSQIEKDVSKDE